MFRKNNAYQQGDLFGVRQGLTKKQKNMFSKSIEHSFFEHVFCKIDEQPFSVLYTDKSSRPNVPVNQLVGSLILKHLFDWTYEELFKHLTFNLLTRHAIGIDRMDTDIFAEASLFNFQNRLFAHFVETGQDLLMEVFDNLAFDYLEQFGIKTDIQRGDSFLIGSNIVDYNRLQLLIEVLKRLHRILDEQDQIKYKDCFAPYLSKTSGQYIYKVEKQAVGDELAKIGTYYHKLHTSLLSKYAEVVVFKIFSRVYEEHFCMTTEKLSVRPSGELHSGILMSPDDDQATYRDKGSKNSKGYVGHLSETANPKNHFQIITDLTVAPNNIGDAEILEKRLPEMIGKTPDLKEYFTDGMYGSPQVDKLMKPEEIKQYQTGIRGRSSYGGLRIYQQSDESIWVKCNGGQNVKAVQKKSWNVAFDYEICKNCPLSEKCNTQLSGIRKGQPKRKWYFNEKNILAHLRFNNFADLPDEKKTLRAAVESSVRQLQYGMKNGKVRVRTKLRITGYLTLTGIATNLKRLHAYLIKAPKRLFNVLTHSQNEQVRTTTFRFILLHSKT